MIPTPCLPGSLPFDPLLHVGAIRASVNLKKEYLLVESALFEIVYLVDNILNIEYAA